MKVLHKFAGIAMGIAMLSSSTVFPESARASSAYQLALRNYNLCKANARHGFVNNFLRGDWEQYKQHYAKRMESVTGPWHRKCVSRMAEYGWK